MTISIFRLPNSARITWTSSRRTRIRTIYSQAAGLTHFLVHYEGGKYRDGLVAYLVQVYNGQDNPQTLAELTGTPLKELDRQYRQFMERADGKPRTDSRMTQEWSSTA